MSEELVKYYAGGGSLERNARDLERVLRMKLEDSGPFDKGEAAALKGLVDLMKQYRLMGVAEAQELIKEVNELRAATEEYAGELVARMVTLAREGNTAGARGLEKVSGDLVMELNEIQAKLTELGRGSVVRAEPVAGQGWRVTLIQVEGREVFNGEEAAQDG